MTDERSALGVNKDELYRLMAQRDELVAEIDACTKELPLLRLASILLSFTHHDHVKTSLALLPGRNDRINVVDQFDRHSADARHMLAYQFADALRGAPRLYVIGVLTSWLPVDQLAWAMQYIRKGEGIPGAELI